ncbi:hypothetical protein QAD02_020760 [Eretmocerus hayati]|uniref:Uncharacterized protein n=1 Tax=Eretmocerus hayati TaxID=131215 RepID=A0ACC2PNI3_9HYME|nr:hypothetical protein QAD02_020760 [Eretmocerus hayati]
MSSVSPSKAKVDQLINNNEEKDCFVVSFDDKKEKKQFVATVSEVWIDNVKNTISIPPTKMMRKSTILRRVQPDEETWLEYDIVKTYGPYDYASAKRKEKQLSAGESESDQSKTVTPKKRKSILKQIQLPGEKSSSESDGDNDSSSDDESSKKKSKKSVEKRNKTGLKKGHSKSDQEPAHGGDIDLSDSDQESNTRTEPACQIVAPGTSSGTGRNTNQQGQQVLVDHDILMKIQSTQHAVVKALELWKPARQRQRMEDEDAARENDPLPTFKLRTFLASLKFDSALGHKTLGDELQRLFVRRLQGQAGETVSEYTLNLLDYIFEEEVIEKYSWSGLNNPAKKKFKGTKICDVIIRTVMLSFGTKKQVEKSIKSHLQHAEERHCRREKERRRDEAMRREMEEAAEEEE